MLAHLSIHNLVLIEHLEVSFAQGFSVLTGETGAGKSILLDALGFVLGMRGDASLIRVGAEQLQVTAEFSFAPHHPTTPLIQPVLAENEIDFSGDSLILRRTLNQQGRSRAFVNDQSVSAGFLKILGSSLLEIHGQFDRLLDSSSHLSFIDKFSNEKELLRQVGEAYSLWQQKQQELTKEEAALEASKAREENLKEALKELRPLNPQPLEEEELMKELQLFLHQSKIVGGIENAREHLPALLSHLNSAQKALGKIGDLFDVNGSLSALERAEIEVKEASYDLDNHYRSLEFNPRRQEIVEERLHLLRGLSRKYKVSSDDLANLCAKWEEELANLEDAPAFLAERIKACEQAFTYYQELAETLSQKRQEAATLLDQGVSVNLPALKLEQAVFKTEILRKEKNLWSREGLDQVEFKFAANKGQIPQSLAKVASGGERSRLMLVLKKILAKHQAVGTLIFDEIDSGAGGAVASAMGACLRELSQSLQVLSVTHSPQVAAWAEAHYLVRKKDVGIEMRTNLKMLDEEARQEELARMLSGEEITEEARAAASKLRR